MRVCEEWKSRIDSTPLKLAMTAQPRMGGSECQSHVSEVGKYFTANVVVMTGICAGVETKYGTVQYGSVIIAKRVTAVEGGKERVDEYETLAQYLNLDDGMIGAVAQLVEEAPDGRSAEWVKYVPDQIKSPRYVRELILQCVSDNLNITHPELLSKLEEKQLPGITRRIYAQIIDIMKDLQPVEDHWIRADGDKYVVTDKGKLYTRPKGGVPSDDVITGIFDSMVAVPNVRENLTEKIKTLKQQTGDRKVKGVDMESYYFMKQTKSSFPNAIGMVIKGVSDYGTKQSKIDYYQAYAASTSAAFLRHLMTEKQVLFGKMPARHVPMLMPSLRSPVGAPTAAAAPTSAETYSTQGLVEGVHPQFITDAVLKYGSYRWSPLGLQLCSGNWNKMRSYTKDIGEDVDKLEAIIKKRQAATGEENVAKDILKACRNIKDPIYYDVIKEARRLQDQETARC